MDQPIYAWHLVKKKREKSQYAEQPTARALNVGKTEQPVVVVTLYVRTYVNDGLYMMQFFFLKKKKQGRWELDADWPAGRLTGGL